MCLIQSGRKGTSEISCVYLTDTCTIARWSSGLFVLQLGPGQLDRGEAKAAHALPGPEECGLQPPTRF